MGTSCPSLDENLDLLTQAEQIDHTNNIINAIKQYRSTGSGGSSVLGTVAETGAGIAIWEGAKRFLGKYIAQLRVLAPPILKGLSVIALFDQMFAEANQSNQREKEKKRQKEEIDRLLPQKPNKSSTDIPAQKTSLPGAPAQKGSLPSIDSKINLPTDKKVSTKKTEEKLDILNESINSIKTIISGYLQSGNAANNSVANNNRNDNYNTNIIGSESSETQNVQSYNSIRQQRDIFNNFRTVEIT